MNRRTLLPSPLLKEKGIPYTRRHLARLIEAGEFPAPVPLSTRRICWLETEIDDWIGKLVARRDARKAATAK